MRAIATYAMLCIIAIIGIVCDEPNNPFTDPSNVTLTLRLGDGADSLSLYVGDSVSVTALVYLPYLIDSVVLEYDSPDPTRFVWVPSRIHDTLHDSIVIRTPVFGPDSFAVKASAWLNDATVRTVSAGVPVRTALSCNIALEILAPALTRDSAITGTRSVTISGTVRASCGELQALEARVNDRVTAVTVAGAQWSLTTPELAAAQWNEVRIRALGDNGDSTVRELRVYRTGGLTAPPPPRAQERLCEGLALSWSALDSCDEYVLWRYSESGDSIIAARGSDTLYEDTGLATGTLYRYKVQAVRRTRPGSFEIADTTPLSGALTTRSAWCWQKVVDGPGYDIISALTHNTAGNYVATGSIRNTANDSADFYWVEIDTSGNITLEKKFGTHRDDAGLSIIPRSDGGYVCAGLTSSLGAGDRDMWLLFLSASGDTVRTRTYGSALRDCAYSVVERSANTGYWLAGYTTLAGNIRKPYLLKLDQNGSVDGERYVASSEGSVSNMSVLGDGSVVLAGYAQAAPVSKQPGKALLARYGSTGDSLWTSVSQSSANSWYNCVTPCGAGDILASGGEATYEAGSGVVLLSRADIAGTFRWHQRYGQGKDARSCQHTVTQSGAVAVCGYRKEPGTNQYEAMLLLFSSEGDTVWSRGYGGNAHDYFYAIAATADGGYLLAGRTESFGTAGGACYFVKTDRRGNTGPIRQ